jgi:hypothetical protein
MTSFSFVKIKLFSDESIAVIFFLLKESRVGVA